MGLGLFWRRKGKKPADIEAQWPSSPSRSSYSSLYSNSPSMRYGEGSSHYGYSNYGVSNASMRYGEGPSQYGSSGDHEGGSYSYYGSGYPNNYNNNIIEEYDHVSLPRSVYYGHGLPLSPPQSDYYVPVPHLSPPGNPQLQEPWSPDMYVPPPPKYYSIDPSQPPPPFPASYHFSEPTPQRFTVHPSTEEYYDCIIM